MFKAGRAGWLLVLLAVSRTAKGLGCYRMLPERVANVSRLLPGCTLGRRSVCRSLRNKLARVGFFLFTAASIRGV